jgi:hypothetical protein
LITWHAIERRAHDRIRKWLLDLLHVGHVRGVQGAAENRRLVVAVNNRGSVADERAEPTDLPTIEAELVDAITAWICRVRNHRRTAAVDQA